MWSTEGASDVKPADIDHGVTQNPFEVSLANNIYVNALVDR
jgi:hypothetical protein